MGFRSDLDAAHARIAALESDLADANETIASLRRQLDEEREQRREADREKPPSGPLRYDHPPTYFPLARLGWLAVQVAFRERPRHRKGPDSNTVAVWVLYYVWSLFKYLVWLPLYMITLVGIVIPVLSAFVVAGSVLLLPIVVLSRIKIGKTKATESSSWLHGDISHAQAGVFLWVLMSCCMQPLLPLYVRLLDVSE